MLSPKENAILAVLRAKDLGTSLIAELRLNATKADKACLERSFRIFMTKWEILRSSYIWKKDGYHRKIRSAEQFPLEHVLLSNSESIDGFVEQAKREIDLMNGVVKGYLLSSGDQDYLMILMHHLVYDTPSLDIIRQEINTIYKSLNKEEDTQQDVISLETRYYPYFEQWHRKNIRSVQYWKQRLENENWKVSFNQDTPDKSETDRGYACSTFIPIDVENARKEMQAYSLHLAVIAAMLATTSECSANEQCLVRSVFNLRHLTKEDLIGPLFSEVYMLIPIRQDRAFKDWIKLLRQEYFKASRRIIYDETELDAEEIVSRSVWISHNRLDESFEGKCNTEVSEDWTRSPIIIYAYEYNNGLLLHYCASQRQMTKKTLLAFQQKCNELLFEQLSSIKALELIG
ncbi:MAG: condensation domain-containing protein [Cytophagales bacterium]|nr:condensation domain-containing protein [Cytophagales bacterium]